MVKVGAPATATGREPPREHGDHLVEIRTREVPKRPGRADQRVQLVGIKGLTHGRRDDLLREDVEWSLGHGDVVELGAIDRVEDRHALDELVSGQGKDAPLGDGADLVSRAPDPLQERRDGARRSHLADEVHLADVDAELQRRRGDQGLQLAALQALLGLQPMGTGQTPVMRRYRVVAEVLAEVGGEPLREASRVHEDQGRAVRFDERHEADVELGPHLGRHHGGQRRIRDLDREIERADVPGVDDDALPAVTPLHWRARRRAVVDGTRAGVRYRRSAGAAEESGHRLDRPLGRRQSDACRAGVGERIEARQRERQVAAPLVADERMDLVDDHRARRAQHAAAPLGGEQDVERFRRGDEDMWRTFDHATPLPRGGVPGTHGGADLDVREPQRDELVANPGEGFPEVPLDIVAERLQRRHVDDVGLVTQLAVEPEVDQLVDRGQERGEGLPAAGRGRDERIAPSTNLRPRPVLRLGRRRERRVEPVPYGRVEGRRSASALARVGGRGRR